MKPNNLCNPPLVRVQHFKKPAPKPGTKAYNSMVRARNKRTTKIIVSMGTKYHMHGSNCVHVSGKFGFINKDRVLPRPVFLRTPERDRCGVCFNYLNR